MTSPATQERDRTLLLTDGGEDDDSAEDTAEENETEAEADAEDEDESEHPGDESPPSPDTEGATTVLFLDLEGIFLELLGLEVDLDEVVLEVEAVPGSGNLLGNLLSGVSGLLDTGLGGGLKGLFDRLFGGLFGNDDGAGLDVNSPVAGVGDRIGSAFRDAASKLPIEELISQVVTGLVRQLLEEPTESAEEAAASGDGNNESESES